jgi:hypothetical protein
VRKKTSHKGLNRNYPIPRSRYVGLCLGRCCYYFGLGRGHGLTSRYIAHLRQIAPHIDDLALLMPPSSTHWVVGHASPQSPQGEVRVSCSAVRYHPTCPQASRNAGRTAGPRRVGTVPFKNLSSTTHTRHDGLRLDFLRLSPDLTKREVEGASC